MTSEDIFFATNVQAYEGLPETDTSTFQLAQVYGFVPGSGLIIPVRRLNQEGDGEKKLFSAVLSEYFRLDKDQIGTFKDWPRKACAGENNGINLRLREQTIGYATTLFIPDQLTLETPRLLSASSEEARFLSLQNTNNQIEPKDVGEEFWQKVMAKQSVGATEEIQKPQPTEQFVGHPRIDYARVLTPVLLDTGKMLIVLEKGQIPAPFYRTAAIVAGLLLDPSQMYKSSTPLSTNDDNHYALVLHTSPKSA